MWPPTAAAAATGRGGLISAPVSRLSGLDWLLIVGWGPLEEVLRVYVEHYNRHRAHRGLQLLAPDPATGLTIVGEDHGSSVCRRDLLGGLLHEYRRAA
jgi:putative transposase